MIFVCFLFNKIRLEQWILLSAVLPRGGAWAQPLTLVWEEVAGGAGGSAWSTLGCLSLWLKAVSETLWETNLHAPLLGSH